jgi:hypothetical protein
MRRYDYVSPGLVTVRLDRFYPHLAAGDPDACPWPYLRREVPHVWYIDERHPRCGQLSRDEAMILYNTARGLDGARALEIGCWKGWSTGHLIAAGLRLDVVDPVLQQPQFLVDVHGAATAICAEHPGTTPPLLSAGPSPDTVDALASAREERWRFFFIDGSHHAPAPLHDAWACHRHAAESAVIVLHDLVSPDVAQGLDYLAQQGWSTAVYQTMQIMAVAWRGALTPVPHQPDPAVDWQMPHHLAHHERAPQPRAAMDRFGAAPETAVSR